MVRESVQVIVSINQTGSHSNIYKEKAENSSTNAITISTNIFSPKHNWEAENSSSEDKTAAILRSNEKSQILTIPLSGQRDNRRYAQVRLRTQSAI